MAATLTTADSILKEFYVGPIQEQLNNECLALQIFEQETVEWQGRKAIVPVHIARSVNNAGVPQQNTAFVEEDGTLPTAGGQGYEKLEIDAKFMYGRFGFTGPALEMSEGDKGSFEPVMTGEMKRVAEDCRVTLDKAAYTGGRMIGFVWQKQNSTTWQYSGRVDNTLDPYWGVAVNAATTTVEFVRLEGASAYDKVAGGPVRVNSITEKLLTTNVAIDTSAITDCHVFGVLYVNSVALTPAKEMVGINGNLADQTHFNVDRTTATGSANAPLRSNFLVADFAAAAPVFADLSLDALQILLDKILLASNAEPDGMLISPVHRQSYTTLLQGTMAANTRVDIGGGAKKNADGGFKNIGYADIPFKTSQHCPKGSVYMIARKHWGVFQRRPGDFAQADGKVLNKVTDKDAYQGYWKQYLNLVAKRPNANGVLTGVSYFGI